MFDFIPSPYRGYVRFDSIPRCLRHLNEDTILHDAQNLTAFLQRATEELYDSDDDLCNAEIRGMSLAFDLLRDKLACLSGDLAFPLGGADAAPPLWNPEPEQGGDV